MSVDPSMRPLIEAGFTADELRAIGTELMFAVQMAHDFHTHMTARVEDKVDWTLEKRAAWRQVLDEIRQERRP